MDNDSENEVITKCLLTIALAMGIDPSAIAVAGRRTPIGYELNILIIPDTESESDVDKMMSEAERIINNG